MSKKDNVNKFELWETFFEEREKYDPEDFVRTQRPLRLPDQLYKQVVKDLRILEDEGIKSNFTEYTIVALMLLSNSMINEKGDFTSKRNGKNLDNYLKYAKGQKD